MPQWKLDKAKAMRKKPTPAEAWAWARLRELRHSHGMKFRRQSPAFGYIMDFYCPARQLCIEVDGGYHAAQAKVDATRDSRLAAHGILTVRYLNDEVLADPGKWIKRAATPSAISALPR